MLKIVIVTNNYKPYSGGVVSSVDSYAQTMKSLGHQVSIITYDFLNEGSDLQQGIYRIDTLLRFKYKKNIMPVCLYADRQIFTILQALKPDIVHSQHPFLLGQSALKACKKLNLPIVFTYHTQYEQYLHYIPFPQQFLKPVVKEVVYKYSNAVDGIIAPSNLIKNTLMDNDVKKAIQVIPSGILPIFIMPQFKFKNENKIFKLFTVSRFVKEKNIEFLLNVFSQLNQDEDKFKFTLIGFGAHLDFLKNYAFNVLNINQDSIEFIEKPSKNELSQYYKDHDLFLFASKTETQGLVMAEAMANGSPVIALDAPGSNEIIIDKHNGFLIQDEHQMIQKINEIAKSSDLFQQMQLNAFNTAQNYYPINTTNRLLELYQKTICSKR